MKNKYLIIMFLWAGIPGFAFAQSSSQNYIRTRTMTHETDAAKYTEPNSSLARQYVGNKVYENGALKRILFGNGFYSDGNYYFYLRDHLGNNCRVHDANGILSLYILRKKIG